MVKQYSPDHTRDLYYCALTLEDFIESGYDPVTGKVNLYEFWLNSEELTFPLYYRRIYWDWDDIHYERIPYAEFVKQTGKTLDEVKRDIEAAIIDNLKHCKSSVLYWERKLRDFRATH